MKKLNQADILRGQSELRNNLLSIGKASKKIKDTLLEMLEGQKDAKTITKSTQAVLDIGTEFINETKEWTALKTNVTNAFNTLGVKLTMNKGKNKDGNKVARIEPKVEKPKALQEAQEEKAQEKKEEEEMNILDKFLEVFDALDREAQLGIIDTLKGKVKKLEKVA